MPRVCPTGSPEVPPEQYAGGIWVVETFDEARELLRTVERLPGPFGLDVETVGVDPSEESPVGRGAVVCWSLAWPDPGLGTNIRGTHLAQRAFLWARHLDIFKSWLENPLVPKVVHGGFSFDRHVLFNHGIKVEGIRCDTLRLARLLNANKDADHSLKGLMERCFGYRLGEYRDLFRRRTNLGEEDLGEPKYRKRKVDGTVVHTLVGGPSYRVGAGWETLDLATFTREYPDRASVAVDYGSLDAKGTVELSEYLEQHARGRPWVGLGGQTWGTQWDLYQGVWNPFLSVLWDVERAGIRYDPGRTEAGRVTASVETARLLETVRAWTGDPEFNPGSPPQLTDWLYGRLKLPVPPVFGSRTALKKTPPGKQPTTEASLAWLKANGYGSEGLDALIAWRKESRQAQFLEKLPHHVLPETGRIHSILQPEADTGRLTSKNPNLQQIPKRYDPYGIRGGFVPAPGCVFVVADYSQLEMVVLAHFLVELFDDWSLANDVMSGDSHSATAERLGLPREVAKEINYGINYGKSAMGLSLSLGVSQDTAQGYLDTHAAGYPGIPRFQQHCFNMAQETGVVRTLAGRTRPLLGAKSSNWRDRGAAERQASNTPIQGSAADIVVAAMLRLPEHLRGEQARVVLQVHDELIVECPGDNADRVLRLVRETMENPFSKPLLRVPLKVDAHIGNSWLEAKQ